MKQPLMVASAAVILFFSILPSQAIAASVGQVYAVTKVAANDGLNMRTQPGTAGSVLQLLPANAKGILSTGIEKRVGQATWVKVVWAGKEGWVNKHFLRDDEPAGDETPPARLVPPTPATNTPPSTGGNAAEVVMRCVGTEPFWNITISQQTLKVDMLDGPQFSVPVKLRERSANSTSIAVVAGNRGTANTTAFLEKVEACSDGMSDKNYTYSVTAVLNGQKVVSGCCSVAPAR